MENLDILKAEIKSILAMKAKNGATYQEIEDEYFYVVGKDLCFDSAKQFNAFMETIPDVCRSYTSNGRFIWFTKSEKSKHIVEMIDNQKTEYNYKQHVALPKKEVFHNTTSNCYYKDNYFYKNQKKFKSFSSVPKTDNTGRPALFYNYELIGDDFFLNIAHLDLKQKIEYLRTGFRGYPVKQCGRCVSGQRIKDVTKMLKSNAKLGNRIILNIGSVDLLNGNELIDLKQDFTDLYLELERRGIHSIITTLAPLANMCYLEDFRKRWAAFNSFLINNFPNVINLATCFLTNKERVIFDCYQSLPKYVTGSNRAHSLWNFIGRQRVIKYLKEGLGGLAYRNSNFSIVM